jgi:cytochrome c oxidase assembly protein subunit 11
VKAFVRVDDKKSQAVPSVAPSNAADYLKKLECFCFEQQVLEPGEEAYLPVRLLVSNDLPDSINSIVMSYTIFDITDYNNEDLAHHNMGME